ncbi:MAG: DUF1573 domain-containing protein [Acidobacteriota bacterium]
MTRTTSPIDRPSRLVSEATLGPLICRYHLTPRLGVYTVVAVLFATLCDGCLRQGSRQPRVAFDYTQVDVGQVVEGQRVEREFAFKNTGEELLVVERLVADCACTAALPSAGHLRPGESAAIRVAVDTRDMAGAIQKRVTVECNDPEQRTVTLVVAAMVRPELLLSSRTVDFGQLNEGMEATRRVRVMIAHGADVRLLGVRSTNESISAWLEPTGNPAVVNVTARVLPRRRGQGSALFGNLVLTTTSLFTPELRVPIRGTLTEAVRPNNRRALVTGYWDPGRLRYCPPDRPPWRRTHTMPPQTVARLAL